MNGKLRVENSWDFREQVVFYGAVWPILQIHGLFNIYSMRLGQVCYFVRFRRSS